MLLVLGAVFFTFAVAFGLMGADYFLHREEYEEKARLQARIRALQPAESATTTIARDTALSANPYVHYVLERIPGTTRLREQLAYADWNIRVDQLLLMICAIGAAVWVVTIASQLPLIGMLCLLLVLLPMPLLYMRFRIQQRVKKFTLQFPDALSLMISSLRAGHGLQAALQLVAEQMDAPIGTEFEKVGGEMEVGMPFRVAMRNLGRRVDSHELKLFVTAILIQTEVGGNIVEMLNSIDETIRERIRILGQVQVLTAQGRLTGVFLGSMPIFLAVFILIRSPEYLGDFLADPRGQQIMMIATALWLFGFYTIRRITNIQV